MVRFVVGVHFVSEWTTFIKITNNWVLVRQTDNRLVIFKIFRTMNYIILRFLRLRKNAVCHYQFLPILLKMVLHCCYKSLQSE